MLSCCRINDAPDGAGRLKSVRKGRNGQQNHTDRADKDEVFLYGIVLSPIMPSVPLLFLLTLFISTYACFATWLPSGNSASLPVIRHTGPNAKKK